LSGMTDPSLSLSQAEQEVMLWLAKGKTNMQIAHARGCSPATVRNQLHRVFRKLGVRTRGHALTTWLGRLHSESRLISGDRSKTGDTL
jgi:DNA-binding CsgD family transcriptional regulator